VIPAAFDYEVAESVDHALALLADDGDAKLLAGGHSLIPAMKLRISRPTKLVDVGRLADLAYVRDGGAHVAIGALTTHAAVAGDSLLQEHCPIVRYAAGQIGDPQVRHRGTIGGTIAHGDPASDMPAVVLALGAEIVVRGKGGERVIAATEFFTGVFTTALAADEMLVEVRVPKLGESTGWAYIKANRRAQDWATVGVAALVHRDNGAIAGASIGLVNMGGTPLRATAAEDALASGASISDAAALVTDGTEPPSDHAGSSEYRAHLARVIGRRALEDAFGSLRSSGSGAAE
jgi:aerobic carbon-monoxide dehydrogenase medium subunit